MRALAGWSVRHRRLVVAGWLVALIGLVGVSQSVGSSYKDSLSLKGTQSFQAQTLLNKVAPKASGDREQIVVAVRKGKLTDPAVRSQVEAMLAKVSALPVRRVSRLALRRGGIGSDLAVRSDRVRKRDAHQAGRQDHESPSDAAREHRQDGRREWRAGRARGSGRLSREPDECQHRRLRCVCRADRSAPGVRLAAWQRRCRC